MNKTHEIFIVVILLGIAGIGVFGFGWNKAERKKAAEAKLALPPLPSRPLCIKCNAIRASYHLGMRDNYPKCKTCQERIREAAARVNDALNATPEKGR